MLTMFIRSRHLAIFLHVISDNKKRNTSLTKEKASEVSHVFVTNILRYKLIHDTCKEDSRAPTKSSLWDAILMTTSYQSSMALTGVPPLPTPDAPRLRTFPTHCFLQLHKYCCIGTNGFSCVCIVEISAFSFLTPYCPAVPM